MAGHQKGLAQTLQARADGKTTRGRRNGLSIGSMVGHRNGFVQSFHLSIKSHRLRIGLVASFRTDLRPWPQISNCHLRQRKLQRREENLSNLPHHAPPPTQRTHLIHTNTFFKPLHSYGLELTPFCTNNLLVSSRLHSCVRTPKSPRTDVLRSLQNQPKLFHQ